MVAPGLSSLRAHPLLPGRSGPPLDTLWLRPSHGPALHPQPLPLATLARLADALWLRRAATAPRAAPPSRSGGSGTLAGAPHSSRLIGLGRATRPQPSLSLFPSGRRRRYNPPRNFPRSLRCALTRGLQRARLSWSSRGRAQTWVVWPPGKGRFRRREGRACRPT